MSNDDNKQKKSKEAGFTSIDNRLMAKQDITIHQKVLLSQVVSMMNSTGRYNASNDYITATTGFNKKTIGKAFKVFNERGWLYHKPIPGGGRWVFFNQEHRSNLKKYIGTVEEHKEFLESLKKTYDFDDILVPTPDDVQPMNESQGIKIDIIPQEITASDKSKMVQQLARLSDSLIDGEPTLKFGEPDTIEYCYLGTWLTITRPINDEIRNFKNYIEGLTPEVIWKVCEGEPVDIDMSGFEFRYKQMKSA